MAKTASEKPARTAELPLESSRRAYRSGLCPRGVRWLSRAQRLYAVPDDRSGAASASAGGAFGLAGATTGTADAGVSQTVCSPSRHRGDALARRARHGVTSGQL